MAKDPAFLFYSSDFITGVQTMTFEDRGKFITILGLMHQQGRMDEETIRFLVGSVSDKLKSKFVVDEHGLWYNVRLESETQKRNNFTESRRINGILGGRPKRKKASGKPKHNLQVNHMGIHMEDVNVNVNEDKNIKEPKLKIEILYPFDTDQFKQAWNRWKEYRKEIGKPYRSSMSEQAALKMLSKYNAGEAMRMIERSIANGWQGIFESKENGKQTFDAQGTLDRLNSYGK